MVSIHNDTEFRFVASKFSPRSGYWLGGIQLASGLSSFMWIDGSEFNYTKWRSDFPSGYKRFPCVAIDMDERYFWDISCYEQRFQLCQIVTDSTDKSLAINDDRYPQNYIKGLIMNEAKLKESMKELEKLIVGLNKTINSKTPMVLRNYSQKTNELQQKLDEYKLNLSRFLNTSFEKINKLEKFDNETMELHKNLSLKLDNMSAMVSQISNDQNMILHRANNLSVELKENANESRSAISEKLSTTEEMKRYEAIIEGKLQNLKMLVVILTIIFIALLIIYVTFTFESCKIRKNFRNFRVAFFRNKISENSGNEYTIFT
ncbi:hypothetical protein B4U79_16114 [Dinothrombium tinctorium]|uniref:C-type lectin domain-containing protein n=1 Tax=Dinothrombium tinctorium TaxID=1965070 RepID=A0A443QXK9_9ACAR|nr:hypothetical protein B4U79_16114 [Dinothrombium tinctorium]